MDTNARLGLQPGRTLGNAQVVVGLEVEPQLRRYPDHFDTKGGVYVLDVSDAMHVTIVEQMIVPGTVRSVAAPAGFVYADDTAATIDVIELVLP